MGGTLFSAPDQFMLDGMEAVCEGVDRILPAPKRHLGDVPAACRELSALLTADRDEMDRPYWLAPRLAAAYLRYFLPWNLARLCALLPSLQIGDVPPSPVAADVGSGQSVEILHEFDVPSPSCIDVTQNTRHVVPAGHYRASNRDCHMARRRQVRLC